LWALIKSRWPGSPRLRCPRREQKVEVTIYTMRNGVVRVEDTESNMYAAIDLVCDKIRTKLTRVKEKAISKGKWPGRAGPKEDVEEEDFQEYLKDVSGGEGERAGVGTIVARCCEEVGWCVPYFPSGMWV
jgi:ribosome-associated translation inhibitor RaiA